MAPSVDDIIVKDTHTNEEYLGLMKSLLPKGKVWYTDITALVVNWVDNSANNMSKLLAVFAAELKRIEEYALSVYAFTHPITSEDFDRWDTLAGNLSDNYTIPYTEEEMREDIYEHIFGEFVYVTDDFMIEQAANLGWTITIDTDQFEEYGCELGAVSGVGLNELGVDSSGEGLNQLGVWNRYALVNVDADGSGPYACPPDQIVNRLNKLKPAHTVLVFGGDLAGY